MIDGDDSMNFLNSFQRDSLRIDFILGNTRLDVPLEILVGIDRNTSASGIDAASFYDYLRISGIKDESTLGILPPSLLYIFPRVTLTSFHVYVFSIRPNFRVNFYHRSSSVRTCVR